jgi:predicted permease
VGLYVVASAGAFEALDIPLLQGRHFDRTDTPDRPHVAIVNEAFAREYWPGERPVGRSVTGGGMDTFWQSRTFAEVVGVVGDARFESLGEEPTPTVFFPYSQRPSRLVFGGTLLVESANGDAGAVGPLLRETIQRRDSDVPISLTTQEAIVAGSVAPREFTMLLLAGFSLVALLLAVVGIYGVVSYSVAQRTREMGIRLALGADPGGVLGLVMRGSMRMVLFGLVVGVAGALLTGRVMQGMLYGIAPTDPIAIVSGVLILGGAALVASWVPARLGTRVDPMVTMRSE